LVVFIFCDVLLSPLGFETRGQAILSNPASLPWLALLIIGLVLNVGALVILFLRPRLSSVIVILGSILYLGVLIADQARIVTPVSPPLLITDVEVVTFFVLVAAVIHAARVFRSGTAIISSS
jgi:hypothetical protein